jgi:hypothetical protein
MATGCVPGGTAARYQCWPPRRARSRSPAGEGLQVELVDRLDHEPREAIGGQPIAQVGRQQQRLVAIAGEEVLSHARDGPKRAGQQGLWDSLHSKRKSPSEHKSAAFYASARRPRRLPLRPDRELLVPA